MPGETPSVVFINHWAKNLGGAEYSLLDILASFPGRIRTYLITSEPGPLLVKAADLHSECRIIHCSIPPGKNMREHFLRTLLLSPATIVSFFRFVFTLSRFIKSINPIVIHANIPLSHMALFLLSLFGYRGKCCFHMREIFKRNSLPAIFYQLFFPLGRGHIIAISESVKYHLPFLLRKNAVVIHNGVNVPSESHQREYRASATMRFLYLGRVVPWKGCHQLIAIFTILNKRRPQEAWTLSIIGDTVYWDDSYRDLLNGKIRDSGLESKCTLLPHTDDPALAMHSHDVFVNASFQEPFGRSIAEAQAEGLAVVAFDSGAIREIVEHEKTGFLVPYGDNEAFVRVVEHLMNNRNETEAMGKRGHERAKRFFNRDIQMPKICDEILRGVER
jgi:glycosyltransferase involved in cell wall biosynthesis